MRSPLPFLFCLLLAGTALAVSDPTPDLLGIYFDETAEVYCQEYAQQYVLLNMYAVYSNPSVPEIMGFDFALEQPDLLLTLGVTIPGWPFWDPIENYPYVVAFGEPRPVGEANVLVQFTFLPLTIDPAYLFVVGSPHAPYPDQSPSVWLPDGSVLQVTVRGAPTEPTAWFNDYCVVDTKPATFGAIKSLYR
jgi:hypothetical protein